MGFLDYGKEEKKEESPEPQDEDAGKDEMEDPQAMRLMMMAEKAMENPKALISLIKACMEKSE